MKGTHGVRKKPKALDLFCAAGGATRGLQNAGFEVVGVDINPQPRYIGDSFIQTDALLFSKKGLRKYDFIWASPPCQHYTQMLNHGLTSRDNHPDLIDPVRDMLKAAAIPYVIENVANAPLISPFILCGEMFGLRVIRHRFFEASMPMLVPPHVPHRKEGAMRKQGDGGYYFRVYGHETGKAQWGAAMGIDWMKSPDLAQAIPPAYSEFIGRQVLERM